MWRIVKILATLVFVGFLSSCATTSKPIRTLELRYDYGVVNPYYYRYYTPYYYDYYYYSRPIYRVIPIPSTPSNNNNRRVSPGNSRR